ncbi:hypothetical protein, partial [Eudoraea sp.]|uniref:hypothetical protein n=1 Tax=Eudoraea sp. TaxID=1979955 RepID=UPI003C70A492
FLTFAEYLGLLRQSLSAGYFVIGDVKIHLRPWKHCVPVKRSERNEILEIVPAFLSHDKLMRSYPADDRKGFACALLD